MASGDNLVALLKGYGQGRVRGDDFLATPEGKGKGRASDDNPLLFKGSGKEMMSGDNPQAKGQGRECSDDLWALLK